MNSTPVIDMHKCTDCESCLDLCPFIFRKNEDTGRIEVVDMPEYPKEEIQEVINYCPGDCITWEETPG